jgi:site-specific recombinase XerD
MTRSTFVPVPVEQFLLPSDLDGSTGSNRVASRIAQIAAKNDLQAIHAWLNRFIETKATYDNYRREAERVLLWSTLQLGKPLSSLTHEDFLIYQQFLLAPQPRERWVADGGKKYSRDDSRWRPFYKSLSASSRRQAIVILRVMFDWLVTAGYLAKNPLLLSRHRSKHAQPRITRYLDIDLWQELKVSIDAMTKETDRERAHYFRVRWLFTLLYLTGLRISEVVENSMGCFFCRHDKDGEERWWLDVFGKGNKERLIPATRELMVELVRYRREVDLPPYPSPNEETPLVLPIGKTRKGLTRGALHLILKKVFREAAERLRQRGNEYVSRADQLEQASAHWLRHTAGSHMADQQLDLRLVRDNLGHGSLRTTSLYLHLDDDRRHKETEEKHRIGW